MGADSFTGCARPVSAGDLVEAEGKLGIKLPQDFKEHYLKCNGGTPEPACWVADEFVYFEVESFIPIKYEDGETESQYGRIEDAYSRLTERKLIPPSFLPFARDWGGNFFCLDVETGGVYFYAMDVWDDAVPPEANQRKAAKLLTSGFSKFVEGLADAEDETADSS